MSVPELFRARWRASSYSSGNGACVEVAPCLPAAVVVRDSKDRHGPELAFTAKSWRAFARRVKAAGPA